MIVQYHPSVIDATGQFREIENVEAVPFEEISTCPVCRESKELMDVTILKNSIKSTFCENCGHFFHSRRPTAEWFSNWYKNHWDQGTFNTGYPSFRKKSRLLASGIKNWIAKRNIYGFLNDIIPKYQKLRVLEIGCGYGNQLIPFKLAGHDVCAIEASSHRAKFTRRLGIHVLNMPIEQLDQMTFGKPFDVIFANHVLEHILDPHLFLSKVKDLIKPSGWLSLFVPNFSNESLISGAFSAAHPHIYSLNSMEFLLKHYGFQISRTKEDYEISVLAQRATDSENILESRPVKLSKESTFQNILGSGFQDIKDKDYFCHWQKPRPQIRSIFKTNFSFQDEPGAQRQIRLRWSGDLCLPITFEKEGKSAPFWIK